MSHWVFFLFVSSQICVLKTGHSRRSSSTVFPSKNSIPSCAARVQMSLISIVRVHKKCLTPTDGLPLGRKPRPRLPWAERLHRTVRRLQAAAHQPPRGEEGGSLGPPRSRAGSQGAQPLVECRAFLPGRVGDATALEECRGLRWSVPEARIDPGHRGALARNLYRGLKVWRNFDQVFRWEYLL